MGIYHDQVIEAAYLHTKPGCFYIGPFARRVSFASQQFRALDLVAALSDKGKLVHPPRHPRAGRPKQIAVIGAGIAGLTAAAALRGQGCTVHLYERMDEPLVLQKNASHRLVHPTISRWPAERLELTTDFPFLDWFAAPCDRVIACLRTEWLERLAPRPNDPRYRFLPERTVTGISVDRGVIRLVVKPALEGVPIAYDYAFVTTGFDEEETAAGRDIVSYWTEDRIEEWRRDEERQIYISGCGDGGLIDALRLVHGHFDRGWLTIRLAQMLSGVFDKEIVDAENDALMAAKSLACMEMMTGSAKAAAATDRKVGGPYQNNQIVRRLTAFYRDRLVPRLPAAARALLDESLKEGRVAHGRVTLVSRQEEPFGPHSAPIHKIMVEHAIASGSISYRRGELKPDGDSVIIEMEDGADPITITEEMGLIVRHGSPANLAGLASRAESSSLRIRQFVLADYIETETRHALPPPRGYPSSEGERERERYIGIRWAMARELLDSLIPGAAVTALPDRFSLHRPLAPVTDRQPLELPTPRKIFGIPLEDAPMIEAEAL